MTQPASRFSKRFRIGGIGLVCVLVFLFAMSAANFWPTCEVVAQDGNAPAPALAAAVAAPQTDDDPNSITLPRQQWANVGLKIEPAGQAALTDTTRLTGKISLNEDRIAHVFPLVEGRVEKVQVQLGQRVKQGELLVIVQSKEVGQRMLQLFQDRLKLEFAEIRNRWSQEITENTLSLIQKIRSKASIEEIETSFSQRTMGDYRERLMSAYVATLRIDSQLERLSPLIQSGAVPGRQIVEAEAEQNANRANLQSLLEQISQDVQQDARLAEQAVRELQVAVAVAETNLRILGFEDHELKDIDPAKQGEQLAHYPIVAPFDGSVITKDVVLLERVGPEWQILTIADLSTVWVTADIYETHLPLLSTLHDQKIYLRSEAWPNRRFEAKVFYTGDVVQESSRTVALRAIADNQEELLKPGMFVTIEIPGLNTSDVVQVARSAILEHEGKSFVFVQTGDETFVRRDVSLGRNTREMVEITSGLSPDERVVVSGGFTLKSKMLADLLAE